MTPDRLQECFASLGWTQRGGARVMRRLEGTIRQWKTGVVQIPAEVDAWLEMMVQFLKTHPPPRKSVRGDGKAPRRKRQAANPRLTTLKGADHGRR